MNRLRADSDTAQLRITAAGALATSLAAVSLSPVFTRHHWLAASLVAIAVVAAVGAGARALSIARAIVVVLQLVGLAIVGSALFAPQSALLGLVPTTTTMRELLDVMSSGATSINQQIVPVLDVPGIAMLVALGIGLAAIEVDFTAVACRCPAISGIVLLAVYGVPATVLKEGTPPGLFAVASAGWLLLLYVSRREAVLASGTLLIPESAHGVRPGGRPSDPRAALGWRIAAGTVLSGVVLAGLIPGIGDGAVGRFGPTIGGSGSSARGGVRLDLSATLERNLTAKSNTPLLTYRALDGAGQPQYLRLAVLDRFNGVAWTPAAVPADARSVNSGLQRAPGFDPLAAITQFTRIRALDTTRDLAYLPAPYTAIGIDEVTGSWLWDTRTSTVFSRSDRLNGTTYIATSQIVTPRPEELANAKSAVGAPSGSTTAPAGLPTTVGATAATVTEGATTDYAKAVRLQSWFRANFRYSLEAKQANTADAISTFLRDRSGYCQQFAATYALMARTLGVPTRVVVGFAPGVASADGTYTVSAHDYHAWPEVWFNGAGWVRFEPTPRSDAGSTVAVPTWSLPSQFAPVPTPKQISTTAPTPTSAPSAPAIRRPAAAAQTATSSSWTDSGRLLSTIAVVLLVLFLGSGPGVARALRRRRRLAQPPTRSGVECAWAELADIARDLGLPWNEDDTPRRIGDALIRDAELRGPAAMGVQQLRHDVEQARYSQQVQVIGTPAELVREVRSELMTTSTPRTRWRAVLIPRTILRRRRRGTH